MFPVLKSGLSIPEFALILISQHYSRGIRELLSGFMSGVHDQQQRPGTPCHLVEHTQIRKWYRQISGRGKKVSGEDTSPHHRLRKYLWWWSDGTTHRCSVMVCYAVSKENPGEDLKWSANITEGSGSSYQLQTPHLCGTGWRTSSSHTSAFSYGREIDSVTSMDNTKCVYPHGNAKEMNRQWWYRERLLHQSWRQGRDEYFMLLRSAHVSVSTTSSTLFKTGEVVRVRDHVPPRESRTGRKGSFMFRSVAKQDLDKKNHSCSMISQLNWIWVSLMNM